MPNPIQRMLKQARDAVPGQRPIRLPWQEPTLGERVAGGLDALADTAGEIGNRAADARLAAGDRASDVAQRAQDRVSDIRERTGGQMSDAQERASGHVADVRKRTRARLRGATSEARGQASQVTDSAQRAQASMADRLGDTSDRAQRTAKERLTAASDGIRQAGIPDQLAAAGRRVRDTASTSSQNALPGLTPDEASIPANWRGSQLAPLVRVPGALPYSAEDASLAADRAAMAAARAERASNQTLAASNQIAALLSRLMTAQPHEAVPAEAAGEGPSDIEIRVGEAAQSPLARAADAVARAVAATGETIYDYSEGQYGLAPRDARELRREREKERAQARPVAIIEGHYAGEKQSRSRLPLLIAGLLVVAGLAGIAGFWFMQRRSQFSHAGAGEGRPARAPITDGPPTVTPAFDRVVRGDLLQTRSASSATGTTATSAVAGSAGTVTQTPPLDVPAAGTGPEGGTRTFVAGEPSETQTTPGTGSTQPRP